MITAHYSLRINSAVEQYQSISDILGVQLSLNGDTCWIYEVENRETDPYFDFVSEFMKLLKDNFVVLEKIGVTRSDISFWAIYEYENQFNVEFSPDDMKRMADEGIALCLSCYQI